MPSSSFTKSSPNSLITLLQAQRLEDTCFIIGGGPSLRTYLPDVSILYPYQKNIICTNNAYKLFPNAVVTHFGDRQWFTWHENSENKLTNFCGHITTADKVTKNLWDKHPNVICFSRDHLTDGLSSNPNYLNGNNAGHQSINLAYLIGYKNIVLLGFDLAPDWHNTHWHNEHRRQTNVANFEHTMIPGFNTIAPLQKELGIRIFNINKDSYIRCFEFANLDTFL